VRDIHPGEELTDDYATLNLEESFACLCGTRECRNRISPERLKLVPVFDGMTDELLAEGAALMRTEEYGRADRAAAR
jgi:hypothetical protein